MSIQKNYKNFRIHLFDDILYDLNSADNSRKYNHIYADRAHDDYFYLTRHGIEICQDEKTVNTCLVVSNGGTTRICDSGILIDGDKLLICCAQSIFCLSLPDLKLTWRTTADGATCFGIFKCNDSFIVHGELAISNLGGDGQVIWQFSGNDISTTPTGKNSFSISDGIIYATNWDNITFTIDARTGRLLNQHSG